ncbi:hypothetical protein [Persicobacter diffluens]|uniref:Uncharacterized protein n=1 Tax=Persicobacter diffluens TaxID=981 RepID=A0AAN4W4S7_9BACT|nr:hypothetical protein PEDI_51900 [Persicobacter diffluens]
MNAKIERVAASLRLRPTSYIGEHTISEYSKAKKIAKALKQYSKIIGQMVQKKKRRQLSVKEVLTQFEAVLMGMSPGKLEPYWNMHQSDQILAMVKLFTAWNINKL